MKAHNQLIASLAGRRSRDRSRKHHAAPGVFVLGLLVLIFRELHPIFPGSTVCARVQYVAPKDGVVRAELIRITHKHEPPLWLRAPSPDGIEHRTEQRLHAPRRDIDNQPPALAFLDCSEPIAQEIEMPVPLERSRRFQNGPGDMDERFQVALRPLPKPKAK